MFDDSKVTFDVAHLSGDDVHLNACGAVEGWAWSEVRVTARYGGIEDITGEDHIHFYSRIDKAINWVTKYLDLLEKGAKTALFAKLKDLADRLGLDELIDPYEGDPRNEIADLADSVWFADDRAYAKYEGEGLSMRLHGKVERVLTVLRAAHGRD